MNYSHALKLTMLFYQAQKSGGQPIPNIPWRGTSFENDGSEVGVDLSGGYYDAGDHVKFLFPHAFTFTTLGWSVLEFTDQYKYSNQYDTILNLIKYCCDFLMKCHTAPNELWIQIGDGSYDHSYWGPVEVMHLHKPKRPCYKITKEKPGSDVASEVCACLAVASILFQDSDITYSQKCLQHARELYTFATTYRGKYSDSVPEVAEFYKSWSGYDDDIAWASVWMYKATNEDVFKQASIEWYSKVFDSSGWTLGWDDKSYGVKILMHALFPENDLYNNNVKKFLDFWLNDVPTTPDGLSYLTTWGNARYPTMTAFLCLVYHKNGGDAKYRDYAIYQVDYVLGSNHNKFSYVIGYGDTYSTHCHHRGSHSSWNGNITTPDENRNILFGALVGGPNQNGEYKDDRSAQETD